MFTGIVEEVGQVCSINNMGDKARLVVQAKRILEGCSLGDSINIDGVCQTVAAIDTPEKGSFAVDTLAESLKKTTLGKLRPGSFVNLERALRADSRMGGHFVQGHVSCTVRIQRLETVGNNVYLEVEIPEDQLRYCVPEGSIALDGISLTIAGINGNLVTVNIIPVTLEVTSLGDKKSGDLMNLETDIIGRYVERLLGNPGLKAPNAGISFQGNCGSGGLSFERMRELGY